MTLFDLTPNQLNFLSCALGSAISDEYDNYQLYVIANFLVSLGANLYLITSAKELQTNKRQCQNSTEQPIQ